MNVTITLPLEAVEEIATRAAEIVMARIGSADRAGYVDVKAAADYLGVTEGRVRKLVERRQIPFIQDGPGCRITFSVRDLDQFMQDNRNERRQR